MNHIVGPEATPFLNTRIPMGFLSIAQDRLVKIHHYFFRLLVVRAVPRPCTALDLSDTTLFAMLATRLARLLAVGAVALEAARPLADSSSGVTSSSDTEALRFRAVRLVGA